MAGCSRNEMSPISCVAMSDSTSFRSDCSAQAWSRYAGRSPGSLSSALASTSFTRCQTSGVTCALLSALFPAEARHAPLPIRASRRPEKCQERPLSLQWRARQRSAVRSTGSVVDPGFRAWLKHHPVPQDLLLAFAAERFVDPGLIGELLP